MSNLITKTVTPAQEHVKNLTQMCIIESNDKTKQDQVEAILNACKSEYEMSRKLHDVWTGNKTIDTFIQQYGGLLC